MLSPTMFLEGTYGFIRNELTGGNENGILMNDSANRLNGLAQFPLVYPDAGLVPTGSYAFEVLQDVKPPFWDGTRMNLPPTVHVGRAASAPRRPTSATRLAEHQPDAGRLDQLDQDCRPPLAEGGFYNNHSFKAQNIGGTAFQGASSSTTTPTTRSTPSSAIPTPRWVSSTATRRARSSSRAACSTTTSRPTSRTTGRSTAV
jgi:hypothetical protein